MIILSAISRERRFQSICSAKTARLQIGVRRLFRNRCPYFRRFGYLSHWWLNLLLTADTITRAAKPLVLRISFQLVGNNKMVLIVSQDLSFNTLPPALYVVAMPIGQWSDLAPRAIEVLSQVNLILAEDTRVSGQI